VSAARAHRPLDLVGVLASDIGKRIRIGEVLEHHRLDLQATALQQPARRTQVVDIRHRHGPGRCPLHIFRRSVGTAILIVGGIIRQDRVPWVEHGRQEKTVVDPDLPAGRERRQQRRIALALVQPKGRSVQLARKRECCVLRHLGGATGRIDVELQPRRANGAERGNRGRIKGQRGGHALLVAANRLDRRHSIHPGGGKIRRRVDALVSGLGPEVVLIGGIERAYRPGQLHRTVNREVLALEHAARKARIDQLVQRRMLLRREAGIQILSAADRGGGSDHPALRFGNGQCILRAPDEGMCVQAIGCDHHGNDPVPDPCRTFGCGDRLDRTAALPEEIAIDPTAVAIKPVGIGLGQLRRRGGNAVADIRAAWRDARREPTSFDKGETGIDGVQIGKFQGIGLLKEAIAPVPLFREAPDDAVLHRCRALPDPGGEFGSGPDCRKVPLHLGIGDLAAVRHVQILLLGAVDHQRLFIEVGIGARPVHSQRRLDPAELRPADEPAVRGGGRNSQEAHDHGRACCRRLSQVGTTRTAGLLKPLAVPEW
jgi:hypothetical protein